MMKHKWLALVLFCLIIWIASASRPGRRVEGCLKECAPQSMVMDGRIRVISLNMLHGFPSFEHLDRRIDVIAAQINQLNPDIVLLQEVPWTLKRGSAVEILAKQTRMNYAFFRANGNRWAIAFEEGEAILSRYRLENPRFLELQPRSGRFEHRVVLHLNTQTEFGEVRLFVTHLSHDNDRANQSQIESLLSFIGSPGGAFSIISGDFNALPDSPQISGLPSEWMDPFEALNNTKEGYTCCIDSLTEANADLNKRIDYLFIVPGSSNPQVISANRIFDTAFNDGSWIWASDHAGLMVTIGAKP